MSAKHILATTISFLVLLTSSFYVFHELSQPIANYEAITWVYGLETLKREDIIARVTKEKLDGKPILMENPVRISNKLKRHPLIASAKVKRFIIPESKIKIYIKENKFWARYGSLILDENAKPVVNCKRSHYNARTQAQLQAAIAPLVTIESSQALDSKDLSTVLKLCKLIESSTKLKVTQIKADREKNCTIYTNHYYFKIGLLDSKALKRTERVTLVLDQLRSIDKNKTDLEYIDLSLASSEVILGRKQVAVPIVVKPSAAPIVKKLAALMPKPIPKPLPKPVPKPATVN